MLFFSRGTQGYVALTPLFVVDKKCDTYCNNFMVSTGTYFLGKKHRPEPIQPQRVVARGLMKGMGPVDVILFSYYTVSEQEMPEYSLDWHQLSCISGRKRERTFSVEKVFNRRL